MSSEAEQTNVVVAESTVSVSTNEDTTQAPVQANTEEVNTNTKTRNNTFVPTDWSKIDSLSLSFLEESRNFKVCLGTCGQLVAALTDLANQKKVELESSELNSYQQSLYPNLMNLANEIVTQYNELFVLPTNKPTDVDVAEGKNDNVLKRQVYGANLNGVRNNGALRRVITTRGVRRETTYKYVQFGQLVRVLTQRLEYIVSRKPEEVERYKTDQEQCTYFTELQSNCLKFLEYLNGVPSADGNSVNTTGSVAEKWNNIVALARTAGGVVVEDARVVERTVKRNGGKKQFRSNTSQDARRPENSSNSNNFRNFKKQSNENSEQTRNNKYNDYPQRGPKKSLVQTTVPEKRIEIKHVVVNGRTMIDTETMAKEMRLNAEKYRSNDDDQNSQSVTRSYGRGGGYRSNYRSSGRGGYGSNYRSSNRSGYDSRSFGRGGGYGSNYRSSGNYRSSERSEYGSNYRSSNRSGYDSRSSYKNNYDSNDKYESEN